MLDHSSWCCTGDSRCRCRVSDHWSRRCITEQVRVSRFQSLASVLQGRHQVQAPRIRTQEQVLNGREQVTRTQSGVVWRAVGAGATCSIPGAEAEVAAYVAAGGRVTGTVCVKASVCARRHPSPLRCVTIRTASVTAFFGTLTAPRHRTLT